MTRTTRCLALLAALTACTSTSAPPAQPLPLTRQAMPEFAFLFRPTRALTPDELPRRNAAAREWALTLQREGTLRHASPLENEGFAITRGNVTPITGERAVASVLIIQAVDLARAIELASGHPGLEFGTEIEVRAIKAVSPPPSR